MTFLKNDKNVNVLIILIIKLKVITKYLHPLLEMKINLARCKTSKIEFVGAYTDWWRILKLTCVFFQRKTKTYVPYFLFNPTRKVCSLLTRCISFISAKYQATPVNFSHSYFLMPAGASKLIPVVFSVLYPVILWILHQFVHGFHLQK